MFTKWYAEISVFYTNPHEIILKYLQLFSIISYDIVIVKMKSLFQKYSEEMLFMKKTFARICLAHSDAEIYFCF